MHSSIVFRPELVNEQGTGGVVILEIVHSLIVHQGFLTVPALAHVGDVIAGIDAVPPSQREALPPIQANYGLLLPAPTGGYRWVCHEALTEPKAVRAPTYVRNTDGVWLATLADVAQGRGGATLFRSADGGCSWDDVAGVPAGVQLDQVAFSVVSPNQALVASNTPDTNNAIYASTDAGATWQAVAGPVANRVFHSVGFLEDRGYATATTHAGDAAFWWREGEDGTWVESPVPLLGDDTSGVRFAVLDAEGAVLWGLLDPLGNDDLIRSEDAGATWQLVTTDLGLIADAEIVGGDVWVTLNNGIELAVVSPEGAVNTDVPGFRALLRHRAGRRGRVVLCPLVCCWSDARSQHPGGLVCPACVPRRCAGPARL